MLTRPNSRLSNIALLILQQIFQSFFFFFCYHKVSKRRVTNGTKSNGLNLFLRIREIIEQGLGHLFCLSTSHFFNKIDFDDYLVKQDVHVFMSSNLFI